MEVKKCVEASTSLVLVGVIGSTILSCFKVDKTQQLLCSHKAGSLIRTSLIPNFVCKLGLAQDLIFFEKFLASTKFNILGVHGGVRPCLLDMKWCWLY